MSFMHLTFLKTCLKFLVDCICTKSNKYSMIKAVHIDRQGGMKGGVFGAWAAAKVRLRVNYSVPRSMTYDYAPMTKLWSKFSGISTTSISCIRL